jgi:hypothetical protein
MHSGIQNFHRHAVEKVRVNKHILLGYVFLFLVFMGAISSVYYWENKEQAARTAESMTLPRNVGSGEQATDPSDSDLVVCAQVITSAFNPRTGEIREYPTPCDVPEGWQQRTP